MNVDPQELKKKIIEIYPEIEKYSVETEVNFDDETDSWVVTVRKGDNELSTHVEKQDAESCLQGKECVYLGTQIGRFIQNYCLGGDACET
jgi:hypothetical protein